MVCLTFFTTFFLLYGARRLYDLHLFPRTGRLNYLKLAVDSLIVFLPAVLFFTLAGVASKGSHYVWLPVEIYKIPLNFVLLFQVSPGMTLFFALAALAIIYSVLKGFPYLVVLPVLLAVIAIDLLQLPKITNKAQMIVYVIPFALPAFISLAAYLWRYNEYGSRFLFMTGCVSLLFWHYTGILPLDRRQDFNEAQVKILYPRAGEKSTFPLAFLRDFEVDTTSNFLFTAYGPTSGMVRLNLADGTIRIIDTGEGMVRYLGLLPGNGRLLAVDYIKTDFLLVDQDPFRIATRTNVYFPDYYVIFGLCLGADRIYAIYTDMPGVVEFDPVTFQPLRRLLLYPEYAPLRSSGLVAALDKESGYLFVEVGQVDLKMNFRIIRINLNTFQVDGSVLVPDGGLDMVYLSEKKSVLQMSFFTDHIQEIDAQAMQIRRVLHGPLGSRGLVYDAKRDLFYATSFLKGELWVMRYSDGQALKKIRIGNKSSSLALDAVNDRLHVGSTRGILQIDLPAFLADVPVSRISQE
jgi:hypothetical protein